MHLYTYICTDTYQILTTQQAAKDHTTLSFSSKSEMANSFGRTDSVHGDNIILCYV